MMEGWRDEEKRNEGKRDGGKRDEGRNSAVPLRLIIR
jgi:hypothetical protein